MNRNSLLVVMVILAAVTLAFGGYYVWSLRQSPGTEISSEEVFDEASDYQLDFANSQEYVPESMDFSVTLPYGFSTQEDFGRFVNLFFLGPTQEGGEVTNDGISITFIGGRYEESNFMDFVTVRRQSSLSDPTSQSVSEIQPTVIAGIEGYKFTSVTSAEYEQIYLPLGDSSYMYISVLVKDPDNREYSEMVDDILASLET